MELLPDAALPHGKAVGDDHGEPHLSVSRFVFLRLPATAKAPNAAAQTAAAPVPPAKTLPQPDCCGVSAEGAVPGVDSAGVGAVVLSCVGSSVSSEASSVSSGASGPR